MKRTTSFGFGTRGSLQLEGQASPAPGAYVLPSAFDRAKAKGKTFGVSRDAFSRVFTEANPPPDRSIPGPGAYCPLKPLGTDKSKFSFRIRPPNIDQLQMAKTPGPGAYRTATGITSDGFQYYSRFQSSGATKFNPASSKRFKELAEKLLTVPGPGQYQPLEQLSRTGNYFIAKYGSSQCRSFGKETRNTLTSVGTHLKSPGPGTYVLPSMFDGPNPKEAKLSQKLRTKTSASRSHGELNFAKMAVSVPVSADQKNSPRVKENKEEKKGQ